MTAEANNHESVLNAMLAPKAATMEASGSNAKCSLNAPNQAKTENTKNIGSKPATAVAFHTSHMSNSAPTDLDPVAGKLSVYTRDGSIVVCSPRKVNVFFVNGERDTYCAPADDER
jgi:hypothetical protein